MSSAIKLPDIIERMSDNSQSARIARMKNRTLSIFHANNPRVAEAGRYITDESTRTMRALGSRRIAITASEGYRYEIAPCCTDTATAACEPVNTDDARLSIPVVAEVNPPYQGTYNLSFTFSWSGFIGAVSYDLAVTCGDPFTIVRTGETSAIVYVNAPAAPPGSRLIIFTVTGVNACSTGSAQYGMSYPLA